MRVKAIYCLLVFLVGCAQVPRPSSYPYTFQHQMQAAHHWRVLASQMAGLAAAAIKGNPEASLKPVSIRSDDISPFGQAYRGFLITELIQQGIAVSHHDQPCKSRGTSASPPQSYHFEICWDVQVVVHHTDRIKPAFPLQTTALAGLAFGLAEAWHSLPSEAAGAVTAFGVGPIVDGLQGLKTGPLPHSEAIITTTMTDGGLIWWRSSDVYYVNDRDRQHYAGGEPLVQKSFAVVDR